MLLSYEIIKKPYAQEEKMHSWKVWFIAINEMLDLVLEIATVWVASELQVNYNDLRDRQMHELPEKFQSGVDNIEENLGVEAPDTSATFAFFILFAIIGIVIDAKEVYDCYFKLAWISKA